MLLSKHLALILGTILQEFQHTINITLINHWNLIRQTILFINHLSHGTLMSSTLSYQLQGEPVSVTQQGVTSPHNQDVRGGGEANPRPQLEEVVRERGEI